MTIMYSKESRLLLASLLAMVTTNRTVCAQREGVRMPDQAVMEAAIEKLQLERATEDSDRQEARRKRYAQFESALKSRVERLHRRVGLSDTQRKKLVLAGRVDVKRFYDRSQELENRLRFVRGDRVEVWKILNELSALNRVESRDLFGEHSLFSKILANTLTPEQAARFQVLERENVVQQHQATLKWVLDTWDQTIGLSPEQHQRLDVLLKHETRPPRRFGVADYFGVLLQVSRLPEAKLKAIFRDDQWAKLQPEFAEARRQEPELKREGYVPENDVAAAPKQTNKTSAARENEQG
jgi:hypothetical protein